MLGRLLLETLSSKINIFLQTAIGVTGPTIQHALLLVEEACKTEPGCATHLHLKMGVEIALETQ